MSALDFMKIASRNKRRTFLLFLTLVAILYFIGRFLDHTFNGGGFYTLLALTIALIQSLISYYVGDKIVLASVRAREPNLSDYEERQFVNVVQELSIAAGIPTPKCYVMDDPSPNAFATGRDPKHASVCATTGLLKLLNREELEGVIGHELSHIKNRDILTMTMVAVMVGAIVIIADLLRFQLYFGGARRRRDREGGELIALLILFLIVIFASIIGRLMSLAISRAREYMADAGSVAITRNPLALASALEKIANYSRPMQVSDAVSHLFISDPKKRAISEKDSLWANLWSTHPPIRKRIAILKQMAGLFV
ncbi:MAG: M48 family metallopeptidase [bacterium]|nr:M48 family metallopeptidase [bacterium]